MPSLESVIRLREEESSALEVRIRCRIMGRGAPVSGRSEGVGAIVDTERGGDRICGRVWWGSVFDLGFGSGCGIGVGIASRGIRV